MAIKVITSFIGEDAEKWQRKNNPERYRPTLDTKKLIEQGVFRKPIQQKTENRVGDLKVFERTMPDPVLPPPKRSMPEQLFRNIGMTAERGLLGATAGIVGPGGLLERGVSKLTGGAFKPFTPIQPENIAERAVASGSELAGSALPIGSGMSAIKTVLPKVIPEVSTNMVAKLGRTIMPGALSVGGYEGVKSASEGNSLGQAARDAGMGTIMGAGGELGIAGIGAGLRALKGIRTAPKNIPNIEIPSVEPVKPVLTPKEVPTMKQDGLLGQGSISAAKIRTPQKMEPTGNPGEHVRSFNVSVQNSPNISREVKDINWYNMQPGEKGTHIRRTHEMLSDEANKFISENPEKAMQHATSLETLAKEPDLSVAIGIKLADHYQSVGKHEMADDVLNFVSEHLTRSGQAISAARMLERMSPAGMLKTVQGNIARLNEEGRKIYGKKWNDVSLNDDEAKLISNLKRGDRKAYEETFEKVQKRIANELPATAMEKVNAWRHIAMLLNPKTQIRNIAGNSIMVGMRRTAKQVSAVLQNVALGPEERTQVFKVNQEYKKMAESHFDANKRELLGGPSKYQENIKLNMPNKRVFKNNALENTRKFTYKLLEMGDTPFFRNAYVNRLASYAQAKGIKNLDELPDEAFRIAKQEAEQATYSDASEIANLLNRLKNPDHDATILRKSGAVLTEAIMPFTKTPINIIKRGIQYSPAGIVNGVHMWKSQKLAADGIDEMAKGLTGTGILSLGYLLAKHGILTGKASKDTDQKAYDANTGNSPFLILGKYTYDWAQPFSIPLAVGVEIYNALKENPMELKKMDKVIADNDTSRLTQIASSLSTGIYDALAASGDTVFNMSVLRGVKQLIGNPQGVVAGLAELPQDYATQFIPTAFGQLAGVVDPTVRQTYVKGNLPESAKSALMAKTPFLSMKAQPKQTPFGTDVKGQDNIASRAFSQLLSPGIISVDQGIDPKINKEVKRLSDLGLKRHIPTMVPNYIEKTQKHPRINLTPEEATKYQKRTGELTLKAFNRVLSSNKYIGAIGSKKKNMDADEVRAEILAKVIAESKAQAKSEILKSKGYSK